MYYYINGCRMGRNRRRDKELTPADIKLREEVWDRQAEKMLSESARRLRRALDSNKRSLSSTGTQLDPFSHFKKVASQNPPSPTASSNLGWQKSPERRVVFKPPVTPRPQRSSPGIFCYTFRPLFLYFYLFG